MNSIELKKNFHELIESINNENLLLSFYDLMKSRTCAMDGQLWKKLNHQEQIELLEAFEESERPEYLISHDDVKKKHKKWL